MDNKQNPKIAAAQERIKKLREEINKQRRIVSQEHRRERARAERERTHRLCVVGGTAEQAIHNVAADNNLIAIYDDADKAQDFWSQFFGRADTKNILQNQIYNFFNPPQQPQQSPNSQQNQEQHNDSEQFDPHQSQDDSDDSKQFDFLI